MVMQKSVLIFDRSFEFLRIDTSIKSITFITDESETATRTDEFVYSSLFSPSRNLARSSTIMISPEFLVAKNKLYRSFSE